MFAYAPLIIIIWLVSAEMKQTKKIEAWKTIQLRLTLFPQPCFIKNALIFDKAKIRIIADIETGTKSRTICHTVSFLKYSNACIPIM